MEMQKKLPTIRLSVREQLKEARILADLKKYKFFEKVGWLRLRDNFPRHIETFDEIDDRILYLRTQNLLLTSEQVNGRVWNEFSKAYRRDHSRKISKKFAQRLQNHYQKYNLYRDANWVVRSQYPNPQNKQGDTERRVVVMGEIKNYDFRPLSSNTKLTLPDVQGRMVCPKHALPCYRGRTEGEYVCPSEQHQGSIWSLKG